MKNIPAELLNELEAVNGFNRESFLAAHDEAPVTSVRLHPIKQTPGLFGHADKVPWCEQGRYLSDRPVFTLDPLFHAGAYYVQEASSMFLDYVVRNILPVRENLRVLDLCGAPGGKSTLLASLLDATSLLISNEVIRARATILEENIVRWGYTNNWVASNDPRDFGKLEGYFDLIVADAPCSGSGLFRKDERAMTEWSLANVQLCSQRQQRILADVWPSLKEEGYLVYATCSYSVQEDEAILDWLNEHFSVATVPVHVPETWDIVTAVSRHQLTGYRFFPDKLKGEGFFIAVLQKKETARKISHPKFRSRHDPKAAAAASFLLRDGSNLSILADKENYIAIHKDHEEDINLLHKAVYLRKTGIAIGMPAVKEWLPAHDIALSTDRNSDIPSIELTREQALKFLRKEDMALPLQERGWLLATYQGRGLGWIKSLGNRFNNYLPKHWRIRMELPSEWE